MGKKNATAAAQRAKKKHQKEQKRKKTLPRKSHGSLARSAAPGVPNPSVTWRPAVDGIEGLAVGMQVPFYEAAHAADHFGRAHSDPRGLLDAVWTRGKVIALETSDLVTRLEQLGVRTDRDAFVAGTPRFGSAARYARESWLPLAPAQADVHARDFVALAACELWKRWRPEAPSQEMLNELLLLGEDFAHDQDDMAATETWIRFWRLLQPLLTPDMRTTSPAGRLLGGDDGLLFNWASDFSMAATHVATHDAALGRRAAEVQEEVLAQFSMEADSWRRPLLCDHAEMLYTTGQRIEGERILREQIEKHPTSAGAYVRLAGLWAPRGGEDRESLARALALLDQAAARPVKDAVDWDLAACILELRAGLRTGGGDASKAAAM